MDGCVVCHHCCEPALAQGFCSFPIDAVPYGFSLPFARGVLSGFGCPIECTYCAVLTRSV